MATETIILRPTGTGHNGTEWYPEETADSEVHMLVSEEVADNDATYVISNSDIERFGFFFTVPTEYLNKTPTSISICFTARSVGTVVIDMTYRYYHSYSEADEYAYEIGSVSTDGTTQYNFFRIDISSDYLSGFYELLKNGGAPASGVVELYHGANFGAKTQSLHITQVYVEACFDIEESSSETIYLKENAAWTVISGAIYRKENGVWVATDSTIFENGDKFVTQEMT